MGSIGKAKEEFQRLIDYFPGSEYYPKAKDASENYLLINLTQHKLCPKKYTLVLLKLFHSRTFLILPLFNSSSNFTTRVRHDIRTILPKYGFISERKYILREVIRLREIPFSFCGVEEIASAKSAFIPKTRVQVYF